MPKPPPAPLPAGTVIAGRYEIVGSLAEGGMGTVYEVIHLETRRKRALKVLSKAEAADEDSRKRFEREATIVAEVVSEHIAEVLDAGVDPATSSPFILMELLKGEELGHMLKRRGRIPFEEVVLYLAQAAVALDKTHALGIVHRDLKPANLFVTYRDDGSPCVKLLDFGIAKAVVDDSAHTTKGILGTPSYLAPEQIRGLSRQGSCTDVYALGQISYTLLTGSPYWNNEPSADENVYGRLIAMAEGTTEPARERAARHSEVELPEAFDAWFAKASALNPDDRHGSCGELVTELSFALGLEPPAFLVCPPTPGAPAGPLYTSIPPTGLTASEKTGRSGITGRQGATQRPITARTAFDSTAPPTAERPGLGLAARIAILVGVALAAGALVFAAVRPGASSDGADRAAGSASALAAERAPALAASTGDQAPTTPEPAAAGSPSAPRPSDTAPSSAGPTPAAPSGRASASARAPASSPSTLSPGKSAPGPAATAASGWKPPVTER